MQNHDVRTNTFHCFKLMRAKENDLTSCCEFFNQTAEDESGTDIQTREWFVQQNYVGGCALRRADKATFFCRIPLE